MRVTTKLVALRKQAGLTQLELAETLGVSRQAISSWEVGNTVPSTENLKALGALYHVPLDYLLNDALEDYEAAKIKGHEGEQTEQPVDEQTRPVGSAKKKNFLILAIAIGLILVAFVIGVVVGQYGRDTDSNEIIPMDDMDVDRDDGYPTVTFYLEGW